MPACFSCYLLIYALTCWDLACARNSNCLAVGLRESRAYLGVYKGEALCRLEASVFARVIHVAAALGIGACLVERVDGVLMNAARSTVEVDDGFPPSRQYISRFWLLLFPRPETGEGEEKRRESN